MDFCKKLSVKEAGGPEPRRGGRTYRLPTEAEWEYGCRAGTTGAYAGAGRLDDMGWYEGSGRTTHTVAQKQANAWGLYDMHGNVWEWCADGYGGYGGGAETDPSGPESSTASRVLRGGGWYSIPQDCRSAGRIRLAPVFRQLGLGLRVAVDF